MRHSRLTAWALCALLAGPAALAQQQEAPGPAAVVERLHAALLDAMKNADALGFEGRRAALAPVIRDVYDLPLVSRVVLGRHWEGLSDKDRATMVDVFGRLIVATYAGRFDGYGGEQFVTRAARELGANRVLVRAEIVRSEGEATRLDYLLEKREEGWKIVNVLADGVSDLALKRADYSAIVRAKGFEALVAELRAQIASYAGDEPRG